MPLPASRPALGLLVLCGVVLLLDAWLGAEAQAAPIGSDQGSAVAESTLEEGGARASFVPASRPHTAATELRRGTVATAAAGTSALEGVDSGESMTFPKSANGVVHGE